MKEWKEYPRPALRIFETVGGYWRVEIHGPDQLRDNKVYSVMDVGRGETREEAQAQAVEWFSSIVEIQRKPPTLVSDNALALVEAVECGAICCSGEECSEEWLAEAVAMVNRYIQEAAGTIAEKREISHYVVVNADDELEFYVAVKDPISESHAKSMMHEHINDAINGGVEGAENWVVRTIYGLQRPEQPEVQ